MKTKLKTLLLFITVTSYTFAQQSGKNFIDQPYIEVTGTVETEIIPNEIYLNIVLNENNTKGKKSVEEMENQMIATLKSLKIDLEKDFAIQDFNGYFKRKFLGENEVTKTKRYELIVHDGKTLGKVYQALDSLNISNISITKIDHSDIENITRETKLKALKAAKAKANDYAQAIDQTIGKAIFIQEVNSNNLNGLYGSANGFAIRGISNNYKSSALQDKIQDLNFKNITVSASVLARFTIN
ncbi:SIMPL domain-containing protein [Aestuariivivens insulae]|uniref:SIMPL domain-containing protein n=1 Tax=Aestuariivivens insulae TaxID=1621988 RepID=UPI001F58F235|nr:SIMPL domain-containing protein [Aestuariivivens insulae]